MLEVGYTKNYTLVVWIERKKNLFETRLRVELSYKTVRSLKITILGSKKAKNRTSYSLAKRDILFK